MTVMARSWQLGDTHRRWLRPRSGQLWSVVGRYIALGCSRLSRQLLLYLQKFEMNSYLDCSRLKLSTGSAVTSLHVCLLRLVDGNLGSMDQRSSLFYSSYPFFIISPSFEPSRNRVKIWRRRRSRQYAIRRLQLFTVCRTLQIMAWHSSIQNL